jgi:hypothetical protein
MERDRERQTDRERRFLITPNIFDFVIVGSENAKVFLI